LRTIVTALPIGALYSLLAASIVVIYRATRVINFAVGESVVLLAYVFVALYAVSAPVAFVGTLLIGLAVGIVLYWAFIRPTTGEGPVVGVLITVGISIILRSAITWAFGGNIKLSPKIDELIGMVDLGGPVGVVRKVDILLIVVMIVTLMALGLIFTKTKLGRQMRAVAERPLLAAQRRVNVQSVGLWAWGLAFLVASIAGITNSFRVSVSLPLAAIGIGGISAALIGGLDSLRGAVVGGLLLAFVEVLAVQTFNPRAAQAVPAVVLLTVLTIRPWGLFGTEEDLERL